jgi:hypothetical protein
MARSTFQRPTQATYTFDANNAVSPTDLDKKDGDSTGTDKTTRASDNTGQPRASQNTGQSSDSANSGSAEVGGSSVDRSDSRRRKSTPSSAATASMNAAKSV